MAELFFWISAFTILYTYAGYPFLLGILSLFKRQQAVPLKMEPTVSLVLSVYNEEKGIEEKLGNLREIDYPSDKLEILVGSDGSTDQTVELLEKSGLKGMQLFVYSERRGKAAVVNDLVREALGEVVVFSDANSLFRVDTLRNLVNPFAESGVGAVSGELVLLSPGNIGESLYWKYETVVKRLESRVGTLVGATGGVYAIRRSLFHPLPLDRAIADDFMIPMRVLEQGYRVAYEPAAVASETAEETVAREFRRKVRIGAQNFNALRYVSAMLNPLRGFVAFALWSHKVIRWIVPVSLLVLISATALLYSPGGPFASILYGEILFFALGAFGFVGERRNFRSPVVVLPYYFLAMNAALLLGLLKSISGTQTPAWEVRR
ncbi:MAG: glycosyltransferase family 2 protein [Ignavibacteriales bacterium]|nr:glycosyltransferase family 2 protein [Ignavibacteriales bacterium]